MKKNIHPKWMSATITCACGSSFETGATQPLLRVEVCSKCHPFYTGQTRLVDTAGQVERFMRRQARSTASQAANSTTGAAE